MKYKEVGHNFLARLGKTKLRPGGIEATNWLIEQAQLNADSQILEVACNMGTTMIYLAKTYQCQVIGLDQSQQALEKARHNIAKERLEKQLSVVQGNALKLPFEDQSFDVVINEAMLTMLVGKAKDKAIKEYLRVLKPNGVLLTHDVCLLNTDKRTEILTGLQNTIHVKVEPLTVEEWRKKFADNGFHVTQKYGKMSLMDPIGMIRDEGFSGAFKIIRNGLKKENKEQFKKMFVFFRNHKKEIGYIATVSQKKEENNDV
jgi:ubiquinone/menaquinone biosynthesis C-methylase UbiE